MMTEAEAKKLQCCGPPLVAAMSLLAPRIAEMPEQLKRSVAESAHCSGAQCMAWLWDMEWTSSTEEGEGGDLVLRLKRLSGEPKRGWCGLAGRP